MDEQRIRAFMAGHDIVLQVYDGTDSTNLRAKAWAREGGSLPAAFIAGRQTAGRGRLGRSFLSPQGGLYMSLALDTEGLHPGSLTTLAAAAVLRAGDEMGLIGLQIKWVNDIMQQGKKVGGILSEGIALSAGRVTRAVVGIGINTGSAVFPPELADKAACLDTGVDPPDRERLAGLIISAIIEGLPRVPEHMALYRARCLCLGRDVRFEREGKVLFGHGLQVTDEGGLVIRTEAGFVELQAGEVSIRGRDGGYV